MAVRARVAREAVFLDKDGTLLEDVPYNVDPARIRLAPTAARALRLLGASGRPLVVITNQSGVARGLFPETALAGVESRLAELMAECGAKLAGFYACPHHPQGTVPRYAVTCSCRKPQPGLLQRAAAELGLSLERSWMVGDILDDVEAGCRAGCRTVLVDRGSETEWLEGPCRTPDVRAGTLLEAARAVLDTEAAEGRAAWAATSPA